MSEREEIIFGDALKGKEDILSGDNNDADSKMDRGDDGYGDYLGRYDENPTIVMQNAISASYKKSGICTISKMGIAMTFIFLIALIMAYFNDKRERYYISISDKVTAQCATTWTDTRYVWRYRLGRRRMVRRNQYYASIMYDYKGVTYNDIKLRVSERVSQGQMLEVYVERDNPTVCRYYEDEEAAHPMVILFGILFVTGIVLWVIGARSDNQ